MPLAVRVHKNRARLLCFGTGVWNQVECRARGLVELTCSHRCLLLATGRALAAWSTLLLFRRFGRAFPRGPGCTRTSFSATRRRSSQARYSKQAS
jgi:hypothetical protein